MSVKLTTQEFIDRARAVHGDKYDYSKVCYKNNREKVTITCPEHGYFEQSPNHHINGHGCRCCVDTKHTNVSFIQKAKAVHGDKYGYAFSIYQHSQIKILIYCHEHGMFEQTPYDHLRGRGCPGCGGSKKKTTEEFIKRANLVHEYNYDYSRVNYVNKGLKVTIVCREHGVFEQQPANHLHGQGCPGCASYGFDRTRPASLYILRSNCGRYMKIGITNNPKQRHNKLKRDTPFSFKRIELIEGQGDQIADLEKELLAKYRPAEFTETFDGYSEWRLWDDSVRDYLA